MVYDVGLNYTYSKILNALKTKVSSPHPPRAGKLNHSWLTAGSTQRVVIRYLTDQKGQPNQLREGSEWHMMAYGGMAWRSMTSVQTTHIIKYEMHLKPKVAVSISFPLPLSPGPGGSINHG